MATINLDKILQVAYTGVRRASAFMALGINASYDPDNRSVHLKHPFHLRFLPDNMSDAQINEVKNNFSEWIVGNGLRELDQSFAIFLDYLHDAGLVVMRHTRGLQAAEHKQIKKKFQQDTNAKSKLDEISARFRIVSKNASHIETMSKARNCLSHANGIVRLRDCNRPNELKITWIGIDIVVQSEQESKSFPTGEFEPFTAGADSTLGIKFVDRQKSFPFGSRIAISPSDLSEICWMYSDEARILVGEFKKYCETQGVPISS